MPPTRSVGRNAIATTTMPTPPNHCSIARQRCVPAGRLSGSVKTLLPVVVMPDIASKSASVSVASAAPKMNGSAPKSGSASQTEKVRMNVCRTLSAPVRAEAQESVTSIPRMTVMKPDSRKVRQSPRGSNTSAMAGMIIVVPRSVTRRPIT